MKCHMTTRESLTGGVRLPMLLSPRLLYDSAVIDSLKRHVLPSNTMDYCIVVLAWHDNVQIQRVSRLGFVTAPTSRNGGQPNFARRLAVFWAGVLCIHLGGGLLPLMEFCVQVVRSPILAALLHGTRAVGVSKTAAWYLHATGWPYRSTLVGRTV